MEHKGQDVTKAFTELAPTYIETIDAELQKFWGISYQDFIAQLVAEAQIFRDDRVLDIATGAAVIPLSIRNANLTDKKVVGLDITPAMLKIGLQEVSSSGQDGLVELVCGSAMTMPFQDRVFRVAICGLGTHHMDVCQLLAETRRVLVEGGRLVFIDVGATHFWRSIFGRFLLRVLLLQYGLIQRTARARAEIEAFENVRTAAEWESLLVENGFNQVEVDEYPARRPWYPCGVIIKAVI